MTPLASAHALPAQSRLTHHQWLSSHVPSAPDHTPFPFPSHPPPSDFPISSQTLVFTPLPPPLSHMLLEQSVTFFHVFQLTPGPVTLL